MSSRAEITVRFAKAYVKAPKAVKGQILDQVVEVTGWSRDTARRRLTAAARPPGAGREIAKRPRRQRKPKYCYDTRKVSAGGHVIPQGWPSCNSPWWDAAGSEGSRAGGRCQVVLVPGRFRGR